MPSSAHDRSRPQHSGGRQTTLLSFINTSGVKRPHHSDEDTHAPEEMEQVHRRRSTASEAVHSSAPAATTTSQKVRGETNECSHGLTPSHDTPSTSTASASPAAMVSTSFGTDKGNASDGLFTGDRARGTTHEEESDADDDIAVGDLLGLATAHSAKALFQGESPSHASSAGAAAAPLTQTFLDLGQASSLQLGRRCPHCAMLFTDQTEDVTLHQRHCHALAKQQGMSGTTTRTEPLAQSTEAADILEALHKRVTKAAGRRGGAVAAPAIGTASPCEKVVEDPRAQLHLAPAATEAIRLDSIVYTLRCASPSVSEAPDVVRLLEALGFYDAVLQAIDYTVVIVVCAKLQRVLAAVAGRPSTRQQDPELVVERSGDGRTRCGHIKSFSFCDVNYLYVAPTNVYLRAVQAAWHGAATAALTSHRDAVRDFFAPSAAAAERNKARQQEAFAQALVAREEALRKALYGLGRGVVYGQQLDPQTDFSFSCTLLTEMTESSSENTKISHAESRSVPPGLLARTVRPAHHLTDDRGDKENTPPRWETSVTREETGLRFHGEDADEDDLSAVPLSDGGSGGALFVRSLSTNREDMDQLSVVSYED